MAFWVDYIWQSTFCLLFFFGIYFIFLKDEKAFTFNRWYLLISPLLSLVFPLINIPVSFNKPDISLEKTEFFRALSLNGAPDNYLTTYGLPEVMIQSTKLPTIWSLQDYIFLTYLIIVFLLIFKLFWSFINMRLIEERGWFQSYYNLKNDYFLIPTFGLTPIFSFFNKLFWDDTLKISTEEKHQILQHELAHIKKKHSLDVMYYQVLSILFWFNPGIYLMRNELIDVHEYQADESVINATSENGNDYPKLIVKIAFKGMDLSIGNYFIRSTTLKRIMMLKKAKKINWTKLFMVIPVSLMLMALVSMKTETGQSLLQQNFNLEEIKKKLIASQDSLEIGIKVKKINAPVHYELIGTLEGDKLKAQIGELEYEFSNIKTDEDYIKVRGLIENLRNSSIISKDYGNINKNSADIDVKAEPEIGMVSWFQKIREQVKLPENEDQLGLIGGNLVVEFVVNENGKIEKPAIVRSLGGGIDQQVIDLLQNTELTNWKPAIKNGENVAMVQNIFIPFAESKNKSEAHSFFKETSPPHREQSKTETTEFVFDVVEDPPKFKGGMEAWNKYIKENLQFPESAKLNKVEGTVYVVFEIDKDGKSSNPEILRGIGYGADEEALRLINDGPDWIPGKQRGQAVNVRMRMPIRFKLDEKKNNMVTSELNVVNSETQPSEDFNVFLRKNIKFPVEARETKSSGTVITALKLNSDGFIKGFDVVESPSEDLKDEVIRVLEKNKHSWIVSGDKEEYLAALPITFILHGEEPSSNRYQGMKNEVVVTGYGPQEKKSPFTVKMLSQSDKEPLYILDGEVITNEKSIKDLDPNQIQHLEVLKGEKALEKTLKFDVTQNSAVIVITTKK